MSEPALLIINGRGQDPSCQLPNGSVNVTVSGGTTPYVYLWSNAETTEDISGLNSGIYSLTVTDIRGCEVIFIDTIIQNNIPISISGAVVSSICYRENTGSIVVTASDGIAPYSFVWSNGQNGNYVDGLAEGNYLVTATDASGCTASASFEVQILQDTLALGLNALTYANGYNISTHAAFDGFINSNIQGGVGPYSYSWSNGASTVNLSNVSAGFYSLMVVDSNGCAVNATILLNEPAPGMPEMPEGISPNDDGKNDVFVIRNIEFFPDNNIYIYNRWGEQLLSFNAYDNTSVRWRGENKDGENLPEGTYYVVAVINVNGEDMVLKGHVDIRR
jgi:gliding motility-associated-like protein